MKDKIVCFLAGLILGVVVTLAILGRYVIVSGERGTAHQMDRWTGHTYAISFDEATPVKYKGQ